MNFVYEQWLLADLRDVAEACLPQNINDVDKIMLKDAYPLQVSKNVCTILLAYFHNYVFLRMFRSILW